jgi:hypothetical protein
MEEKKKDPKVDYSLTKNEIKFSDRVRLRSGKNGFLLTFTQSHPDRDEIICVSEIYLSPEVAGSLASILMAHVANYEKQFNIKITPPGIQVEKVKDKKEMEH